MEHQWLKFKFLMAVTGDYSLLVCESMKPGRCLPTFQRKSYLQFQCGRVYTENGGSIFLRKDGKIYQTA
jgi:hypothetical protein